MKKIVLIFIFFFMHCSQQPDWYPTGNVKIMSYRTYENLSVKNCNVFYSISNTGISKISQSTISFQINTLEGIYYLTEINQTTILPNTGIFDSFSFSFFTNTENVSNMNQIAISGYFFE